MAVTLSGRARPDVVRMNGLQVQLLVAALIAAQAPDRDLLAPHGYVPSGVCLAWSSALFDALPDLVLVEVWDDARAQLRPRGVLRAPVSLQRGPAGRQRRQQPDPWAALPPLAERTRVGQTPLGVLLLHLAAWLGTCGGCTVDPG